MWWRIGRKAVQLVNSARNEAIVKVAIDLCIDDMLSNNSERGIRDVADYWHASKAIADSQQTNKQTDAREW